MHVLAYLLFFQVLIAIMLNGTFLTSVTLQGINRL